MSQVMQTLRANIWHGVGLRKSARNMRMTFPVRYGESLSQKGLQNLVQGNLRAVYRFSPDFNQAKFKGGNSSSASLAHAAKPAATAALTKTSQSCCCPGEVRWLHVGVAQRVPDTGQVTPPRRTITRHLRHKIFRLPRDAVLTSLHVC